MDLTVKEKEIKESGFSVIDNVFTNQEIEDIQAAINRADTTKETFRNQTIFLQYASF